MKLDRNITNPRRGKYALIKLRERDAPILGPATCDVPGGLGALYTPVLTEAIDFGSTEEADFFVIRLKDKYSAAALDAYARAAFCDDPEYAQEIFILAAKAASHPNSRKPD